MSLNARDTNSHPTRHQARYNTACVALSTHTHTKRSKHATWHFYLNCQTIVGILTRAKSCKMVVCDCDWSTVTRQTGSWSRQLKQNGMHRSYWVRVSCERSSQRHFFYQHPAIVLTSHLCEEKPKKQSKFLTKAVDSCRCFVTLHKRISWWTMASSLADTSPYNPNNVASVALLTTLTTYH